MLNQNHLIGLRVKVLQHQLLLLLLQPIFLYHPSFRFISITIPMAEPIIVKAHVTLVFAISIGVPELTKSITPCVC